MSPLHLTLTRLSLCLILLAGCQTGSYRLPGGSSLLGKKSNSNKVSPDNNINPDQEEAKVTEDKLAEKKKNDPKALSPAKNDQTEPQKEDNPFIAYLQKNQGTKSFSGEVSPASGNSSKLAEKNLITPAIASQSSGNVIHDAKTMMLIEAEIRELPPQQQQEMRTLLAGVPAEQVPQILKIRKLLTQQGQTDGSASTQQLAQRPSARPTAYSPGINNVSPWNQKQTPSKAPELLGIEDSYDEKSLGQGQALNPQMIQNNLPTINAGWNPQDNPLMRNSQPPYDPGMQTHPLSQGVNQTPQNSGLVPQVTTNQPQDLSSIPPNQFGSTNQPQGMNNTMNSPAMSVSTNQGGSRWKDDLQRLIATAEIEFSQLKPGASETEKLDYVAKQVYLRMLYLMGDQKGRATQAITDLSPADQEFWQQTLWAFHNYFDQQGIPQEADRANQVISQLQSAIASLQNKAQLEIRNVNFCQKITSFGNYDKFDRQEFQPGEPVLIYAEIRNFGTEPTADGQFRTTLKSTIEIHKVGPQGGLVSQYDFPGTIDNCRNRRQDYFHSYMVNIPERSTLGPHLMKLTIEDQISHKVNTYTMNFNVK